jgi:maleate isomerase
MLGNTYGWRARLGLILPSLNVTTEPEYYRMLPEGVTVHTTRMFFEQETEETYTHLIDDVSRAVTLLSHAQVHALAFACTSGSLYGGLGYDQKIIEIMKKCTDRPSTTTSTAVVEALNTMGIKKVCIGTPYSTWLNPLERKFLEDSGFEVINIRSIMEDAKEVFGDVSDETGPQLSFLVNAVPPQRVYEFAVKKVYRDGCDGIFLSCMGFPTLGVIEMLEKDLGKPVISSNQATLWKLLKMARVETQDCMSGFGSLFLR